LILGQIFAGTLQQQRSALVAG